MKLNSVLAGVLLAVLSICLIGHYYTEQPSTSTNQPTNPGTQVTGKINVSVGDDEDVAVGFPENPLWKKTVQ